LAADNTPRRRPGKAESGSSNVSMSRRSWRGLIDGPDTPTPPNLLRLSIGLEHHDDLIEDLDYALG
jgi:hypothetical protein